MERVELLDTISKVELSAATLIGFIPAFAYLLLYVIAARKVLKSTHSELKSYYSTAEIDWALDAVDLLLVLVLLAVASTISRLLPFPAIQVLALLP